MHPGGKAPTNTDGGSSIERLTLGQALSTLLQLLYTTNLKTCNRKYLVSGHTERLKRQDSKAGLNPRPLLRTSWEGG